MQANSSAPMFGQWHYSGRYSSGSTAFKLFHGTVEKIEQEAFHALAFGRGTRAGHQGTNYSLSAKTLLQQVARKLRDDLGRPLALVNYPESPAFGKQISEFGGARSMREPRAKANGSNPESCLFPQSCAQDAQPGQAGELRIRIARRT